MSAGACGDMECDGHKKALWQDRDGSVLGYPGMNSMKLTKYASTNALHYVMKVIYDHNKVI